MDTGAMLVTTTPTLEGRPNRREGRNMPIACASGTAVGGG